MAIKLCEQCNLVETKRVGEKFCSRRCYWDSKKGRGLDCPEETRLAGSRAGVEAARRKVSGTKQTPEHLHRRMAQMSRTLATTVRECERCRESFTPTHASQRYCCGRCWKAADRSRRPKNPPRFTIAEHEYQRRLESQGRVCAICGGTQKHRLAVDHCHDRMVVRGLLCHRCNTALGLLRDDIAIMERAIAYLCGS